LAGAAEADDELLPEPHPAAAPASTTAAPIAAAGLVIFTARSPFLLCLSVPLLRADPPAGPLPGRRL